jgi:hypothetical protein
MLQTLLEDVFPVAVFKPIKYIDPNKLQLCSLIGQTWVHNIIIPEIKQWLWMQIEVMRQI